MNAKLWSVLLVFLFAAATHAQESVRDLRGPGAYTKFLTPGQLDRWVFEGEKGETIIAHVTSREFDPILELARTEKPDDRVLEEVDDPGSESAFSRRLPEKGQYKIRIHAYKYQGGGNYTLRVQRFRAQPLVVGKPVTGTFDRAGNSYYYFQGVQDQILIPEVSGAWKMLDVQGRPLADWAGTVHLTRSGEGTLVVSGPPENRHDLLLREARKQQLTEGKKLASTLGQSELDVWNFEGKPGDFRLVEVERKGDLQSRLVYAPLEKKDAPQLAQPGDRPEIVFLPVASRGGYLRFAAVLGRAGRYQLQLLAATPTSYQLTLRDPSVPLEWGQMPAGKLPVGGAAFYSFRAEPGQLFQASLAAQQFVPLLRLYDQQGSLVSSSGDDADALEGRLTHMVVQEGRYRLQVASQGDGGGGNFQLSLKETKLRELQIGGRGQGMLQAGSTDFWSFPGKEGQIVFLSVRSSIFEPVVSVRGPTGVQLAADNKGNRATGNLLALRLPRTGRYTVGISTRRGAGEYTVRLIDGD